MRDTQRDSAQKGEGMKRVLITGASGVIGTLMRERLGAQYEFVSLMHRPGDFPSHVGDIADFDAIRPAFEGVEAVVHLAAVPKVLAPWAEIEPTNVAGTRNVYEAAKQAGVKQVIFASSNHAVAGHEVAIGPGLYRLDDTRMLNEHVQIRPDSYYGTSKAFGEALGRQYADFDGLRVISLRIGWVLPHDDPRQANFTGESRPKLNEENARARLRAIWLSHRDCAHLIDVCLKADHIHYGIYYGISNNPRQFHDLTNARAELGYNPVDSAPADLAPV
jgi:nucleoside-diphosphate-sugar epimerase